MRKYTSPPQTYQARPGAGFVSSLYTFPHTLGAQPYIVRMFFKCLIADLGYAVGTIVPVNSHAADKIAVGLGTAATGFTMVATPTDVILSFDTNNGASIHKFDRKKNGRLANNAWEIVLKVYAP